MTFKFRYLVSRNSKLFDCSLNLIAEVENIARNSCVLHLKVSFFRLSVLESISREHVNYRHYP